ncbi:hypothetical protein OQI_29620 [Streptomyces pharetrae CZA14]|uniref:Uncharacterized protein n=1 Tax=Streptomyces pharetrae CZA14 TaxID=1144883 RepID=A0ABX3YBV6_9ACTN|nr:hypothetical protein OQI_29620 [Streptomyces pharetrae CZA14]
MVAADVQRHAAALPKNDGRGALAEASPTCRTCLPARLTSARPHDGDKVTGTARIDPADAPEQDVSLEDGRVNAALPFRRQ